MQTIFIRLSTIQDVRKFVDIVSASDIDIDLSSGRYIVDAKSIMGIFALDIASPIKLVAHTDDASSFFEKIERFLVK